jgi:hypothetical protein
MALAPSSPISPLLPSPASAWDWPAAELISDYLSLTKSCISCIFQHGNFPVILTELHLLVLGI